MVRDPPPGSDILHTYEDRRSAADAAIPFVLEGLRKGESVRCIGPGDDLAVLRRAVEADGLDVDGLVDSGRLGIWNLQAAANPRRTQPGAQRGRWRRLLDGIFRALPGPGPALRWWWNLGSPLSEENPIEACRLGQEPPMFDVTSPPTLLCAFDVGPLRPERDAERFWEILRLHTHMIPAGEFGIAFRLFPEGVSE